MYACDHRAMTPTDLEEWFLGRVQRGIILICLSPTLDQLTAANCMICSVDVWLPMEPTFFLQGSQCKSL